MKTSDLATDSLKSLFQEKLDAIRKDLWYGNFEHIEDLEADYHHQIQVERAWSNYLASTGCRLFSLHELRADFQAVFNELGPETVCLDMKSSEFIFVPKAFAERTLILGFLPP